MLDRWFWRKLSGTGRVAYVIGQVVFFGIALAVIFGPMGLSGDDAKVPLIALGLVFIFGWGFLCAFLWPNAPQAAKEKAAPRGSGKKKRRR